MVIGSFQVMSQTTGAMRSDVRSISKDTGIVLIGQNLCMLKLTFQQWKDLFTNDIEEVKREISREVNSRY